MKLRKTDRGYYVSVVRRERGRPAATYYLRANGRWCNLCPPDGYHRWAIGCIQPLLLLAVRAMFGRTTEDLGHRAEDFFW